jgi:AraC-like DNA-binding protein
MVIYFYSYRVISRRSEEIYAASLEQARTELDGMVNSVFQMLEQMTVNNHVRKLSFVRETPSPDDHWAIAQLVKDLGNYRLLSPFAEDVFVVMNRTNSIVSTIGYIREGLYYSLYYKNDDTDPAELTALMHRSYRRKETYPVGDYIFFLLTTMEGNLSDSTITAVVAVKRTSFDERFIRISGTAGRDSGSLMYIADRDKGREYYAGDMRPGKGPYHILSLDSRATNWQYIYLIPVNVQKAEARRIQFLTLAGLLACSLLGLFLSFLLSRRNYGPVKRLLAFFVPEKDVPLKKGTVGWGSREGDEFSLIDRRAGEVIREQQDSRQAARKYYIYALLEKPFDSVTGRQEMEKYRISLEGEWNLVALFSFPGLSGSLTETETELMGTIQRVLIHVFTEAAEGRYTLETADAGENVAAIVNWSGDRERFITQLEEDIEYTQQEMADFLHTAVLTALGEPRRGPGGIYYSNLEARETTRYLDSKTGQTVLRYRDIAYANGRYRYTQEDEQKLINLIRTGDEKAACALLKQVFEENKFPSGSAQGNTQGGPGGFGKMTRLLAYDILGSLIKGMEQPESKLPEDLKDINFEMVPVGELPAALEQIARNICQANRPGLQNRSSRALCEKVKEYISENYRDPEINISQTGRHFDISPFYLSGIFKEETGLGLLEYINTLRIEEGKKLLEERYNITEIAEKTGFHGSGAFIRVFKKMTGVTPRQYRNIQ